MDSVFTHRHSETHSAIRSDTQRDRELRVSSACLLSERTYLLTYLLTYPTVRVLERKLIKYSNLPTNLIFQPIAVENLGACSSSSSDFISALAHKISSVSGEERETSVLFRRLSAKVSCRRTALNRCTGFFGRKAYLTISFLLLSSQISLSTPHDPTLSYQNSDLK